jgi:hypothetical protein
MSGRIDVTSGTPMNPRCKQSTAHSFEKDSGIAVMALTPMWATSPHHSRDETN